MMLEKKENSTYRPEGLSCATCRFFDGDYCRRRAPHHRDRNEFALIAMLQAIAHAQMKIADIDSGYVDLDVWKETTEMHKPDPWPNVEEQDWCGEWEAREARKVNNSILDQDVTDILGFGGRVYSMLRCESIKTVRELVARSRQELLRVPNFGKVSLAEIELELDKHGLKLRDHYD